MQHVMIVDGDPVIIARESQTIGGAQYSPGTLDNLARADKLAFGVYEVETVNLGSGPVLESGPVYTVEADHVAATYTFREKNAQELDADLDARTAGMSDSDFAKIDYALFIVGFTIAKQNTPALTPAQYAAAIETALDTPAFTYAQWEAWARDQLARGQA